MPVKIIKATVEDIPEVARLFRISRESALPYLPRLHTPSDDLAYFTDTVFRQQSVYVIKSPAKILGFIAFDGDWIHHLYLLPDEMGQGLGEQLLKVATTSSRCLQLWVFARNKRAIDFYKRHGFEIIKQTDGSGNEEREPDILMEWGGISK